MCERELCAEVVQSGTWLYDNLVPYEVWIVKQNFEYWYEPDYDDRPEELNSDGEAFQVVIAQSGRQISTGPARLSLPEAIVAAEEVCGHNQLDKPYSAEVVWRVFHDPLATGLNKDAAFLGLAGLCVVHRDRCSLGCSSIDSCSRSNCAPRIVPDLWPGNSG